VTVCQGCERPEVLVCTSVVVCWLFVVKQSVIDQAGGSKQVFD
jgi:hypothetical protein